MSVRSAFPRGPTLAPALREAIALVEAAGCLTDTLYARRRFQAAEDLDALVTAAEELLEDTGDYEEGADLENDLLSEVDEEGAHERATELPEDETHDDDLDFAWERGPYDPDRRARFQDDTDTDLDLSSETRSAA